MFFESVTVIMVYTNKMGLSCSFTHQRKSAEYVIHCLPQRLPAANARLMSAPAGTPFGRGDDDSAQLVMLRRHDEL